MRRFWAVTIVLQLCATGASYAAEPVHYDRVNLQAVATARVANDWMTAVLVAEGESRDPAELADRINRTMKWALDEIGGSDAVKVKTGNYQTYPSYTKGVIKAWRASQELVLEGRDFAAIGLLVGRLQQQLQVRSMASSVSSASRTAAEDRLIGQALDRFKQRAHLVTTNLDGKDFRIVNLSVGTGGMVVRPVTMMRSMAAEASPVSAPALEAGESTLNVSANGSIEIQR